VQEGLLIPSTPRPACPGWNRAGRLARGVPPLPTSSPSILNDGCSLANYYERRGRIAAFAALAAWHEDMAAAAPQAGIG